MVPDSSDSLREKIVIEATRLFASRGFSGTSMRELTEACGCTKPALYYYFKNKEDLFRQVVSGHIESMDAVVGQSMLEEGSVRHRLHQSLESWISYRDTHPMVMRLFQRLELPVEEKAPKIDLIKMRHCHLEALAELMQSGIGSGELQANLDPFEAAMVLVGSIHFQFELSGKFDGSDELDRQRLHRCVDIVFDGIAQHD